MIPVLLEPVGDPAGVRLGVQRLGAASQVLSDTARLLADAGDGVVAAWEGSAQRLFSLLSGEFASVVSGSSLVTSEFGDSLSRYAGVLEVAQGEVRVCRQRLADLVATTPTGFAPDQAVVNSLVAQANAAHARAVEAARELSGKALELIGGSAAGVVPSAGEQGATGFVSHAHTAGLASPHPAAAGFDVQAGHIQTQINGIMSTFTGYAANSGLYPTTAIVGGSTFDSSIGSPSLDLGASVIGGTSMVVNAPSFGTGMPLVGGHMSPTHGINSGPTYNPALTLIEVGENINRNNAMEIWNRVMPGAVPPVGGSGAILAELLRNGDRLTPQDLAEISILSDGINYGIRTQLLPPGWELVRETTYF